MQRRGVQRGEIRMSDTSEQDAVHLQPVSGQDARRRFLRISGKAAVAAPAAALLLAATSRNAAAQVYGDAGPG